MVNFVCFKFEEERIPKNVKLKYFVRSILIHYISLFHNNVKLNERSTI